MLEHYVKLYNYTYKVVSTTLYTTIYNIKRFHIKQNNVLTIFSQINIFQISSRG